LGPMGKHAAQCGRVIFQHSTDVNDQIHKLWTTDFPDCSLDTKVGMSQEDRRALSFMDNSLEKEGRHFKIGLPWGDEKVSLPDNRALAVTRLAQLRKKLVRDLNLKSLYAETINTYIAKGYARPVTNTSKYNAMTALT